MPSEVDALVELGRAFGDPANDLCIVSEGNVGCRAGDDALYVKASGARLHNCDSRAFTKVAIEPLLSLMQSGIESEEGIRQRLNEASLDGGIPSTESFMHADLMVQTGRRFVGHSHPTPLISLLVLADAPYFAKHRLFPDEVVLCGPAACYVPYAHPGLPLAKEIRVRVGLFKEQHGNWPRTIWIQNHGLICLGDSVPEVLAASQMQVKAARVLLGALQSGKDLHWLPQVDVDRIAAWPDEHYRMRLVAEADKA